MQITRHERTSTSLSLRIAAVVFLLAIAIVHLNLYWRESYNKIPTVGWLFLLTIISGFALAAAKAIRSNWLVDLSIAGFAAGVLGGYLLTLLLPMGLFKFKESGISYSGAISILAEAGAIVVIGDGFLLRFRGHPQGANQQRTGN
jgi:hypothetical protein